MNYWLVKSEPDVFSIQHLRAKGLEAWDGVRNYQARNYLRDSMQLGDLVIFYHSNAEPPGAAGICKVASKARPDTTAFATDHHHFDPKSDPANPRWWLVDMEFVQEFPHIVPLQQLRNDPKLAQMALLRRGNRLSVMPITSVEFHRIVDLATK